MHHLVVVKLEAFEVDDHGLPHILNEIASLGIDQSLVLVALVLVFALEHLWFHVEVQCLLQGLLIFYVQTQTVERLLALALVWIFGLQRLYLIYDSATESGID